MTLGDFRDGIAEAKALLKTLEGTVEINVDVNDDLAKTKLSALGQMVIALNDARPTINVDSNSAVVAAEVENLKNSVESLSLYESALTVTVGNATAALADQRDVLIQKAAAATSLSRRITTLTARETALAAAANAAKDALQGQAAAMAASAVVGATAGGAGSGNRGGAGFLNYWGLGGNVPLFAGAFGSTYMLGRISAVHLALDGVLEASIAVVGATIAMAAGLAAMAPAAQDIYTRLTAIKDVSGALGQNIAPLTGQFDQIQQMAAGPTIGAYGGLLSLMGNPSQYTGSISQVVDGIDSVIAKLDIYQKSQNGFNGVLQHGIGYAGQFETILGNLGKTFTNLLAAEPGTVHYMLDFVQGVSSGVAWLTHFNGLTKTVLGAHAVIAWGGALYSLAGKLLGRLPLIGGAISKAMADPAVAIGTVAVAYLAYNWDRATRAVGGYIDAQNRTLSQMPAGQAANALPGAVKGSIATIQGLSPASVQGDFNRWSNAGGSIDDWIKQLGHDLNQNPKSPLASKSGITSFGNFFHDLVTPDSGVNEAYLQDVAKLQQHVKSLSGTWNALYQTMGPLVKRGYSVQQAFALETLAGVSTNDTYAVMQQKVQNLIRGYGDLGNNAGMLTSSINAVNFAAEQQNSKITAVTQGWSAFLSMITGGTTAFSTAEQQLLGMYQVSTSGATSITVANGKVSASTKATAANVSTSIGGMSSNALQMYSTFANGISDAGNAINQLYTLDSAASLGAQGIGLVQRGSKDLVAQFLPAAKGSQLLTTMLYGLAQQGGYTAANSFQALAKWVGNVKNPSQDYLGVLTKLTGAAGNLATDVTNLANAINPQMTSAMSGAIIAASGLNGQMSSYASQVWKGHVNSQAFAGTAAQVAEGLVKVYGNTKTARDEFDAFSARLGISQGAADRLFNDLIASGGRSSSAVQRDIQAIQNALNGLQANKTITITTLYNTIGGSTSAPRVGVSSPAALHAAGVRGFAKGTSGAASGWAWVGEAGPELVNFRGGENVIPNHVARGYAGGTMGDGVIEVHSHVHLDGKEIFKTVQRQSVNEQRRTGTNGLAKRYR
jgi:hypothetical protein